MVELYPRPDLTTSKLHISLVDVDTHSDECEDKAKVAGEGQSGGIQLEINHLQMRNLGIGNHHQVSDQVEKLTK